MEFTRRQWRGNFEPNDEFLVPTGRVLIVIDQCLRSRPLVKVVNAGKHPAPQYLSISAAKRHRAAGIGIWEWAGNEGEHSPDVVMACCGDVPALETMAAVAIIREHLPDLRVREVNVLDLMRLEPHSHSRVWPRHA